MTDAYLMDANCIHGNYWDECDECRGPLQPCGTFHADDDECDECSEHHCSNPIQCQYCTERRAEDDYESSRHDG